MTEPNTTHPSRQQLADFAAGKLERAEQLEVESHIAECAECCDVLRSLPDETMLYRLRGAETHFVSGETDGGTPVAEAKSDTTSLLPPELVDHPRYRIVRQLGAGGMGVVYEAEHRLMQRTVALKVINRRLVHNPQAINRFHQEVKAAATLAHRNIVTAHDAEQTGDIHFLVMEFVPGTSLAQLVEKHGPLPVLHACNFVMQAAQGLQHAAAHGMVHRDIKPQNLMRTPNGTVKILDFGLARLASDMHAARLTRAGAALGTADYMAPEQVLNSRDVDIRADIYSLGCTLYYLLAGIVPFPESSVVDKVMAQLKHAPRPLSEFRKDVPCEVGRIVERMMAKSPGDRFQSPAEVIDAIKPFARPSRSSAEPASGPPAPQCRPSGQHAAEEAHAATPDAADPVDLPIIDLPVSSLPPCPLLVKSSHVGQAAPPWKRFVGPLGAVVLLLVAGGFLAPVVYRSLFGDTPGSGPIHNLTIGETTPPQTTPAPAAGSGEWIDLIAQLDLDANAVEGLWKRVGNSVVVDSTEGARLMLPFAVPPEYDFEVHFTRQSGNDSVALFFVLGSGQATFEVDAWRQHLAGIQTIAGQTLQTMPEVAARELKNGRMYTALVEVRRGRAMAYLDGQEVAAYKGDGSDLSVLHLWQLPRQDVLGIGVYDSETVFHSVRLRPINRR